MSGIAVRPARDEELDAAGELVAAAYLAIPGIRPEDDWYIDRVRDARGRAQDTDVLVAVDEGGALLGCVSYVRDHTSPYAEVEQPGEAGFRMLGVPPGLRGRGAGAALVEACVERARVAGRTGVAITTSPDWAAARRLYERLGFRRAPDRDFDPVPGVHLVAYVLAL